MTFESAFKMEKKVSYRVENIVFQSYISVACENVVLCGNGLTLPHGKNLDWSKLKTFVATKINVNVNLNFD